MKKITIKRYLNKRIKPIQVYNDLEELGYPLYYRITYNRKTQDIKSLTGAVMTEKAFNQLQETGEPLYYETNYLKSYSDVELKDEYNYLQKAVSFIVNDREKGDVFDTEFLGILKRYFEKLDTALFYLGWLDYRHFKNNFHHDREQRKNTKKKKTYSVKDVLELKFEHSEDYQRMQKLYGNFKWQEFEIEQFYHSFNRDRNLLVSINQIEKITGLNIKPYFYEDALKYWYVINLVIQSHENTAVKIDFILDFAPAKYVELNQKYKYPLSDDEIILISNELKYKALLF